MTQDTCQALDARLTYNLCARPPNIYDLKLQTLWLKSQKSTNDTRQEELAEIMGN